MLQRRQVFGNGKTQPASFRASAHVSPDKTLCQLICIDVQRILRDIFYGKYNFIIPFHRIHIDPRSRHRIFYYVDVKVLQHTPDSPAVCADHQRFAAQGAYQRQVPVSEPFVKLPVDLLYQLVQVQIHKLQLDISRTDFRRLHKVFCQLLQSLRFRVENVNISLDLRVADILTFQKIHIVNDGGQRRLNVMRHIGNQIRFQAFTLHLLLNRRLEAFSHIVDRLSHFKVVAFQRRQVNLIFQIAASDFPEAFPYRLAACRFPHQIKRGDHVKQNGKEDSRASERAQKNDLQQRKYHENHQNFLGCLSGIIDLTAHLVNAPDQRPVPEIFRLDPADQAGVDWHHKHNPSADRETCQKRTVRLHISVIVLRVSCVHRRILIKVYCDHKHRKTENQTADQKDDNQVYFRGHAVKGKQVNLSVIAAASGLYRNQHEADHSQHRSDYRKRNQGRRPASPYGKHSGSLRKFILHRPGSVQRHHCFFIVGNQAVGREPGGKRLHHVGGNRPVLKFRMAQLPGIGEPHKLSVLFFPIAGRRASED